MAINLTKGKRINLKKEDNSKLEEFFVGANWGMIKTEEKGFFGKLFGGDGKKSVDLDLAALLFDENKELVKSVYFGELKTDGIVHSGDDLTGDEEADENDNEVISINLKKVKKEVKYIVFTLNSFNGVKFNDIPYAGVRLYEGKIAGKPEKIFATYKVNNTEDFNNKVSLILGVLIKENGDWDFKALGIATNDRKLSDIKINLQNNFDKLILS